MIPERQILRGGQPAIPHRPQVLGGVEAEAAHIAQPSDPFPLVLRADGLGRILHHGDTVGACRRDERLHVGGLAVQVNRDEGLEPPRGLRAGSSPRQTHLHLMRIQIERVGLDICEDGPRPDVGDGGRRGHKGQCRYDDEILCGHPHGAKSQVQGIGPGGHRHRPGDPQKTPQLFFQRRDVGTKDKMAALQDRVHRRIDLATDRRVLRLEIQHGNGHTPLSVLSDRQLTDGLVAGRVPEIKNGAGKFPQHRNRHPTEPESNCKITQLSREKGRHAAAYTGSEVGRAA